MTPKKDEYMRGYHDGFKGGMAEMLAALLDAESAISASISYYGTDAALSALKSVRAAISKATGEGDFPRVEANARLMAAAPDLLTALKSIAANTCCDTCQEAALVAKAALSKAQSIQSHSKGERE